LGQAVGRSNESLRETTTGVNRLLPDAGGKLHEFFPKKGSKNYFKNAAFFGFWG